MDFYVIITSIGEAKFANAQATGTTVNLTHMAVGDGGGAYYEPAKSQTTLVNETWRGSINNIYPDPNNSNQVIMEIDVPPEIGGFTVREAGVFDADGDLIVIGKYPETYKPVLAESSGKELLVRMIIEVSSAETVNLQIDPSIVLAPRSYVDQQIEWMRRLFAGMVFDATLVPSGVPGFIPALGATYLRADYPYFWSRIQAGGNIVEDTIWQTGKRYGSYSYGDGETTFRVPLLVDFVRGFDPTSGQTMGQWYEDTFQGHWHNLYEHDTDELFPVDDYGEKLPHLYANYSATKLFTSDNNVPVVREPTKGTQGEPRIGPETAPKHVLLPKYIYTGEAW